MNLFAQSGWIKLLLILSALITISFQEALAQINYPDDTQNNRYFTDYYNKNIVRPALSLGGFDSQAQWENTSALYYVHDF